MNNYMFNYITWKKKVSNYTISQFCVFDSIKWTGS